MQIKPALGFYLTLGRTAKINKTDDSVCRRGRAEDGALIHGWWEHRRVQPLKEISAEFLKKLKIEPHKIYVYHSWAHNQRIPLLSHSVESVPSGQEGAQLDEAWTSESSVLWYGIFFFFSKK